MLRFLIIPTLTLATVASMGQAADEPKRIDPAPGSGYGGGIGVRAGGSKGTAAAAAEDDLARAKVRLQQAKEQRDLARKNDDEANQAATAAAYAAAKADVARAQQATWGKPGDAAAQYRRAKTAKGNGTNQQLLATVGLSTARVPAVLTSQLSLPEGVGLLVEQVISDGLAERAGFREHDLLKELDGVALTSAEQLRSLLRDSADVAEVKFAVIRRGDPVIVTLDPRKLEAKAIEAEPRLDFAPTPRRPAR